MDIASTSTSLLTTGLQAFASRMTDDVDDVDVDDGAEIDSEMPLSKNNSTSTNLELDTALATSSQTTAHSENGHSGIVTSSSSLPEKTDEIHQHSTAPQIFNVVNDSNLGVSSTASLAASAGTSNAQSSERLATPTVVKAVIVDQEEDDVDVLDEDDDDMDVQQAQPPRSQSFDDNHSKSASLNTNASSQDSRDDNVTTTSATTAEKTSSSTPVPVAHDHVVSSHHNKSTADYSSAISHTDSLSSSNQRLPITTNTNVSSTPTHAPESSSIKTEAPSSSSSSISSNLNSLHNVNNNNNNANNNDHNVNITSVPAVIVIDSKSQNHESPSVSTSTSNLQPHLNKLKADDELKNVIQPILRHTTASILEYIDQCRRVEGELLLQAIAQRYGLDVAVSSKASMDTSSTSATNSVAGESRKRPLEVDNHDQVSNERASKRKA